MSNGIDVSRWQGTIDWQKVKNAGTDFAIIKAGGSDAGNYQDKNFIMNVWLATLAGIHCGAYYFVGKNCKSAAEGLENAKRFEKLLKQVVLEYPVYLDFEAPDSSNKKGNTDACIAFCDYLESKKYYVGIYASDISGFKDRLDITRLEAYDKWVARYGSSPKYVQKYGMWQYSSSGAVDGIAGRVDLDISYKDYPSIIRSAHLNGF